MPMDQPPASGFNGNTLKTKEHTRYFLRMDAAFFPGAGDVYYQKNRKMTTPPLSH